MTEATRVLISEVGPRDGLQNCKPIMALDKKLEWIRQAAKAGLTEIEVGSFVSARILPQMADTAEVVKGAREIDGLTVAVLAPNLRGAKSAIAAGAHKITLPLSVSETHSIKNINRNHAQVLEEARQIAALIADQPEDRRPHFEGSLSTVFGCTLEGRIAETKIADLAEGLMEAGCDEVGLSDTTGVANPARVKDMIRFVRKVVGAEALTGVHLHNTLGLGLANAFAAYEEGITTFDASLGGLGGCPTAPGATGNIVTEDLVAMFASMGVATGIDLDALLKCRQIVADALPGEALHGFGPRASGPVLMVFMDRPAPSARPALEPAQHGEDWRETTPGAAYVPVTATSSNAAAGQPAIEPAIETADGP